MLLTVLRAVSALLIAMWAILLDVLRCLNFSFVMVVCLVVNAWFGWLASKAANTLARPDIACSTAIGL